MASAGTYTAQGVDPSTLPGFQDRNRYQPTPTPWYIDPNNPMQDNSGYLNLINSGLGGVSGQDWTNKAQGYGTQFQDAFKQMTGADPTSQDFDKYFSNIVQNQMMGGGKGYYGTNYNDAQTLINSYLQNSYAPQIQGYQQQQQDKQLQSSQQKIQDLINQQNQATVKQLTSPEVMQQFKAGLNQGGTLDSGAFSTQLADRLSNAAAGNQSAALGNFSLPYIGGQAGMANQPYANFLGNQNNNLQSWGQGATQQNDFFQQGNIAQQLQKMMQPSFMQQYGPLFQSLIQAGGQAAGGAMGNPNIFA